MPLPNWPKVKQRYAIHERATKNDWDISNALTLSQPPTRKAQYNPHLLDRNAIAALELHCIEHGTILTDENNPLQMQHNFFLDCGVYFNNPNVVIGYSDGQPVRHILVKWSGKGYHGYPATVDYLRLKGAAI